MDFLRILRSLEEFLFEAISWLVFYPRTLWRVVRHPMGMATYVEREEHDPAEEEKFADSVSPPLFLMLSVLIAHLVEIQVHALLPTELNAFGKAVMDSEQNLLLYRSVSYSVWPLLASVIYLNRRRSRLDRETLRRPFYSQCFITAPFVIAFSLGSIFQRQQGPESIAGGFLLMIAACLWYLAVETRWFAVMLRMGHLRAFGHAVQMFVLGLLLNLVIGAALLLP